MANIDNISDEMLAAYLEGNANADETMQVLDALQTDDVLKETLDVAMIIEAEGSRLEVLPMTRLAAEDKENLCSLRCEEYILRRRSITFDEKVLIETARENNWLKPEGAPLHAIGQLLADKGLMIVRKYDAAVNDIIEALSLDNDVIIAVDSDKLYPERPDEEDAPNHAVVVTAIDTSSEVVRIYDPQKDAVISVTLSLFENAWRESCNYMVRVLRSPPPRNTIPNPSISTVSLLPMTSWNSVRPSPRTPTTYGLPPASKRAGHSALSVTTARNNTPTSSPIPPCPTAKRNTTA